MEERADPVAAPGLEALEVLQARAGRSDRPTGRRPGGRSGLDPRWVVGVLAAVALIAGAAAWRWVGRPVPLEDRIPMAAPAGASGSSPAAPTAPTSSSPTSANPSGPPGEPAPEEVVVHVVGAVLAPGVVRIAADSRVVDAVTAAGGLAPGADSQRVNLAAPVVDGSRIVVPAIGAEIPAEVPTSVAGPPPGSGGPGGTAAGSTAPSGPVDLNAATAEQLDALPGVGPATAQAILAHREANGGFTSVEELLDVRGIGEAKLEALRDLVVVR